MITWWHSLSPDTRRLIMGVVIAFGALELLAQLVLRVRWWWRNRE